MSDTSVYRIVRRKAKPGCEAAYEALVAAMFEDARRFPGYVAATLIPPEAPGGEYQINQRFATQADLDRWNDSQQRIDWLEKIAAVADGDPEYRSLTGLEVWFSPPVTPASRPPARWRMTVVSWMGIFPTVAILMAYLAPQLQMLPTLLRTAIMTALIAILMSYVIMPRLTRWMGWWLRR